MNPFPIVVALFRRNRATVLLFTCLVMFAVALGIAISAQERALRQGSARAADRFDLIVGAPGSQTELLMNIVYLQPSAIELLKPEILARLLAEPKADLVAPIGYGDSVDGSSVVGTTAEFVAHLSGELGEGRLFETEAEAVVGSSAPFRLGQTLRPVHGHGDGSRARLKA
jgi:putative ABC transport system permease protein